MIYLSKMVESSWSPPKKYPETDNLLPSPLQMLHMDDQNTYIRGGFAASDLDPLLFMLNPDTRGIV